MDVYEINEILEDHKVWLETDGKQGAKANFQRVALDFEKLQRSDLRMANFQGASLIQADLKGAKLEGANLTAADLTGANLSGAYLQNAQLNSAKLTNANFAGADLRDAILMHADAVGTNFERTNLTGCSVYGASVWNSKLNEATIQSNLIITTVNEPVVTVDDLEVAQFIHLLLNRKKLRNVLDTIISKAVLILGRFTEKRKLVLDAMADELRRSNLLPIIFDFERASDRDFTETIKILAGLSQFVIVDLTKPKSVPQELTATVPDYQMPFIPILEDGENPYSMFKDLTKYDWVLKPVVRYRTPNELLAHFKEVIVERGVRKRQELQRKRDAELEVLPIDQVIKKNA